jgi:hypothetical protein
MYIAIATTRRGDSFEINSDIINIELLGSRIITEDNDIAFEVYFDEEDVYVCFEWLTGVIRLSNPLVGIQSDSTPSHLFMETIVNLLRGKFPRFEAYTDTYFEDHPDFQENS